MHCESCGGGFLNYCMVCIWEYAQPDVYLNTVEWFVKLAILMQRVPVLPELSCELTLMEWPANCPAGSHISADDDYLW